MSIEVKKSGKGEQRNCQFNPAGQPEQNDGIHCSPSSLPFTSHLKFTLKCWPVIAGATIGLCFLTQQVAKWFGIELPDQANIDIVRRYAGWNRTFAFLCLQIIVLLPAIEELLFRYLVFRLPGRIRWGGTRSVASAADTEVGPPASVADGTEAVPPVAIALAAMSSLLFSAAHYIAQPWPDAAFIALFFFGLAQCWLYKKTDRLWCPILNHALFNLTNLVLLFVIPQS